MIKLLARITKEVWQTLRIVGWRSTMGAGLHGILQTAINPAPKAETVIPMNTASPSTLSQRISRGFILKRLMARWCSVKSILPKIAALFGMFLLTSPVWAANAFVQAKNGTWSSGSSFTASSITFGAGDQAYVGCMTVAATITNTISSISDGTNTYTSIESHQDNDAGTILNIATVYAKTVSAGATTVTCNLSNSTVISGAIVVMEFSGGDTSAALDQHIYNHQLNPGTGTDAVTSTAKTTTANGEVIAGFMFEDRGGSITITQGTGFTLPTNGLVANQMIGEYRIQSAAGSIAATATLSFSDGATGTSTILMTGKAAAAGGSTTLRLTTLGVGR